MVWVILPATAIPTPAIPIPAIAATPRPGCIPAWYQRGVVLPPALFHPQGNVKRTPSPSGGALRMAAPYKRHGGNGATRSLRA